MSARPKFEPAYPCVMPWPKIMEDMKEHGCAYSRQALLLGVAWSTYQHWMEGRAEPRHSEGVAILAMHSAVCGEELTKVRQRECAVKL